METASLSDGPIDPELLLLLRQLQKTKAGSNSNTGILIDEDDPEEVDNTDAWSDEIFVEEIRNYRCLWDTSCRAYKDGSKKQQSWRELSQKFKREEKSLKKLWKNLKDNFSKCLKKRDLMTRSGAAAERLPKCKLFQELMFIRDTVANRPSISNINIEEAMSSNGCSKATSSESPTCSTPVSAVYSPETDFVSSKKRKCAKETISKCDAILIEALKNDEKQKEKTFDTDVSFAESIVPILKMLPDKKNRQVKIEIQQILMKYEFDD